MAGISHIAAGMAFKRAAPEANVAGLMLASEMLDLPYMPPFSFFMKIPGSLTHGLFMAGLWSAAASSIMLLFRKKPRVALVYGLAVLSHWILDFITHPMGYVLPGKTGTLGPDLPLMFSGSPLVGLGLYNHSLALSYTFEFGLTVLCVASYVAYKLKERKLKLSRPDSAR